MARKYDEWVTPDGLVRVRGWARDGLTDEEIAARMDIRRTTLYNWRQRFPELEKALRDGKDVADRKVEETLLEKALKGDTTAIIFWLKNRKPEVWRDRKERNTKADAEEQQARIAKLKAEVANLTGDDAGDTPDDGFVEALSGMAGSDWGDGDDETE